MQVEMIRDSYGPNAGFSYGVMKVGNAYFFCSTMTQHFDADDAKKIASVTDWASGKKPGTQKLLRARFAAAGMACETRYDAAHGRRYKLCVYPVDPCERDEARRVTLAASDGLSDTNAEIARPIFGS